MGGGGEGTLGLGVQYTLQEVVEGRAPEKQEAEAEEES